MMVTPCIGVCAIDLDTDLCKGCGRTAAEITRWQSMTDQQRESVMQQLETRHGSHIRNQRRIS